MISKTHLRPRLGFVGLGWIGLHRMRSLLRSGAADIAGIYDSSELAMKNCAVELRLGSSRSCEGLRDLLDRKDLDGIVLATPSALHYEQCKLALEHNLPVFCQKPLGLCSAQTRELIQLARSKDLLLGVDFSYRLTSAAQQMKREIACGELGKIFYVNFYFHNAYGPDKDWFYQPSLSGGGCFMDLGVHLLDLLDYLMGPPRITAMTSAFYAKGKALRDRGREVEDFGLLQLKLEDDVEVRLASSWKLNAGKMVEIGFEVYGTEAALRFQNIKDSYFDFQLKKTRGISSEVLVEPPDDWSGRALQMWTERLSVSSRFDPSIESCLRGMQILDEAYRFATRN